MTSQRSLATLAVVLLLLVVVALALFFRQPTISTVAAPTPTATATATALATATPTTTASPVSAPTGALSGTITGRLDYGSDFIPPTTVYAISTVDPRVWYSVDLPGVGNPPLSTLPPGQTGLSYTITGVTPGMYWVVAYRTDRQSPVPAFYSRAVECLRARPSRPCPDHALAPVTVSPGQTTSGIDVLAAPPPSQPSYPPQPTPR